LKETETIMVLTINCPECKSPLKVKEEHAGKKMKCPKCSKVVPIPAPETNKEEEAEVIEDVAVVEEKPPEPENLFSFDEEAPKGSKKGASGKKADDKGAAKKKKGKYLPCPECGGVEAKRIKWTYWGGFWGPKMFTHVRCVDCGCPFNGKTGDTNLVPIISFSVIQVILVVAPVVGLVLLLRWKGAAWWEAIVGLLIK